jgi:hypothetical protein
VVFARKTTESLIDDFLSSVALPPGRETIYPPHRKQGGYTFVLNALEKRKRPGGNQTPVFHPIASCFID